MPYFNFCYVACLKIEMAIFPKGGCTELVPLFPDVLFGSLLQPNHSVNFCCNTVMGLASIDRVPRLRPLT